jgi:hypothetical protein
MTCPTKYLGQELLDFTKNRLFIAARPRIFCHYTFLRKPNEKAGFEPLEWIYIVSGAQKIHSNVIGDH